MNSGDQAFRCRQEDIFQIPAVYAEMDHRKLVLHEGNQYFVESLVVACEGNFEVKPAILPGFGPWFDLYYPSQCPQEFSSFFQLRKERDLDEPVRHEKLLQVCNASGRDQVPGFDDSYTRTDLSDV
jgi:hypothetical protein